MAGQTREFSLPADAGTMVLKAWGGPGGTPVMALHGWMDNAASFDPLAPLLEGCHVFAPDLAGHGLSSHRPAGADYYIWSYVEEVMAAADSLGLREFALLGHSMGGAIACLAGALYPERITRLGLLDSIGPLVTPPEEAPEQMRKALAARPSPESGNGRGGSGGKRYSTREAAERARADRGVSARSAHLLGLRGIDRDERGFYWRNDPRLGKPNPLSLTEEQAAAFLGRIACPVRLIAAAPGQRLHPPGVFTRRLGYIKDLDLIELDGSHHQHMDERVEEVAAHLNGFLRE